MAQKDLLSDGLKHKLVGDFLRYLANQGDIGGLVNIIDNQRAWGIAV